MLYPFSFYFGLFLLFIIARSGRSYNFFERSGTQVLRHVFVVKIKLDPPFYKRLCHLQQCIQNLDIICYVRNK